MASIKHLQTKLAELQEQYNGISEKIRILRKQDVIETDVLDRYKIEKQLKSLETERDMLEAQIESLEQAIEQHETTEKLTIQAEETPQPRHRRYARLMLMIVGMLLLAIVTSIALFVNFTKHPFTKLDERIELHLKNGELAPLSDIENELSTYLFTIASPEERQLTGEGLMRLALLKYHLHNINDSDLKRFFRLSLYCAKSLKLPQWTESKARTIFEGVKKESEEEFANTNKGVVVFTEYDNAEEVVLHIKAAFRNTSSSESNTIVRPYAATIPAVTDDWPILHAIATLTNAQYVIWSKGEQALAIRAFRPTQESWLVKPSPQLELPIADMTNFDRSIEEYIRNDRDFKHAFDEFMLGNLGEALESLNKLRSQASSAYTPQWLILKGIIHVLLGNKQEFLNTHAALARFDQEIDFAYGDFLFGVGLTFFDDHHDATIDKEDAFKKRMTTLRKNLGLLNRRQQEIGELVIGILESLEPWIAQEQRWLWSQFSQSIQSLGAPFQNLTGMLGMNTLSDLERLRESKQTAHMFGREEMTLIPEIFLLCETTDQQEAQSLMTHVMANLRKDEFAYLRFPAFIQLFPSIFSNHRNTFTSDEWQQFAEFVMRESESIVAQERIYASVERKLARNVSLSSLAEHAYGNTDSIQHLLSELDPVIDDLQGLYMIGVQIFSKALQNFEEALHLIDILDIASQRPQQSPMEHFCSAIIQELLVLRVLFTEEQSLEKALARTANVLHHLKLDYDAPEFEALNAWPFLLKTLVTHQAWLLCSYSGQEDQVEFYRKRANEDFHLLFKQYLSEEGGAASDRINALYKEFINQIEPIGDLLVQRYSEKTLTTRQLRHRLFNLVRDTSYTIPDDPTDVELMIYAVRLFLTDIVLIAAIQEDILQPSDPLFDKIAAYAATLNEKIMQQFQLEQGSLAALPSSLMVDIQRNLYDLITFDYERADAASSEKFLWTLFESHLHDFVRWVIKATPDIATLHEEMVFSPSTHAAIKAALLAQIKHLSEQLSVLLQAEVSDAAIAKPLFDSQLSFFEGSPPSKTELFIRLERVLFSLMTNDRPPSADYKRLYEIDKNPIWKLLEAKKLYYDGDYTGAETMFRRLAKEKLMWFTLTRQSFKDLSAAGMTNDVLTALEPLKDKMFTNRMLFLAAVEGSIGRTQLRKDEALILEHVEETRIPNLSHTLLPALAMCAIGNNELDEAYEQLNQFITNSNSPPGNVSVTAGIRFSKKFHIPTVSPKLYGTVDISTWTDLFLSQGVYESSVTLAKEDLIQWMVLFKYLLENGRLEWVGEIAGRNLTYGGGWQGGSDPGNFTHFDITDQLKPSIQEYDLEARWNYHLIRAFLAAYMQDHEKTVASLEEALHFYTRYQQSLEIETNVHLLLWVSGFCDLMGYSELAAELAAIAKETLEEELTSEEGGELLDRGIPEQLTGFHGIQELETLMPRIIELTCGLDVLKPVRRDRDLLEKRPERIPAWHFHKYISDKLALRLQTGYSTYLKHFAEAYIEDLSVSDGPAIQPTIALQFALQPPSPDALHAAIDTLLTSGYPYEALALITQYGQGRYEQLISKLPQRSWTPAAIEKFSVILIELFLKNEDEVLHQVSQDIQNRLGISVNVLRWDQVTYFTWSLNFQTGEIAEALPGLVNILLYHTHFHQQYAQLVDIAKYLEQASQSREETGTAVAIQVAAACALKADELTQEEFDDLLQMFAPLHLQKLAPDIRAFIEVFTRIEYAPDYLRQIAESSEAFLRRVLSERFVQSLHMVAQTMLQKGDDTKALDMLNACVKIIKYERLDHLLAATITTTCQLLYQRGSVGVAKALLKDALHTLQQTEGYDQEIVQLALLFLSMFYERGQETLDMIETYSRYFDPDNLEISMELAFRKGVSYLAQDNTDIDRALAHFQETLTLNRELQAQKKLITANTADVNSVNNIQYACELSKQYDKCVTLYSDILEEESRIGVRLHILDRLAMIYMSSGDTNNALKTREQQRTSAHTHHYEEQKQMALERIIDDHWQQSMPTATMITSLNEMLKEELDIGHWNVACKILGYLYTLYMNTDQMDLAYQAVKQREEIAKKQEFDEIALDNVLKRLMLALSKEDDAEIDTLIKEFFRLFQKLSDEKKAITAFKELLNQLNTYGRLTSPFVYTLLKTIETEVDKLSFTLSPQLAIIELRAAEFLAVNVLDANERGTKYLELASGIASQINSEQLPQILVDLITHYEKLQWDAELLATINRYLARFEDRDTVYSQQIQQIKYQLMLQDDFYADKDIRGFTRSLMEKDNLNPQYRQHYFESLLLLDDYTFGIDYVAIEQESPSIKGDWTHFVEYLYLYEYAIQSQNQQLLDRALNTLAAWYTAYRQPGYLVRISQIFLSIPQDADSLTIQAVKEKAEDILSQIQDGATFADMAGQYSEHPSAESGGELGTFQSGELAPPFDVVFEMNAGETSELLQTERGWHILHVSEKKPLVTLSKMCTGTQANAQKFQELLSIRHSPILDMFAELITVFEISETNGGLSPEEFSEKLRTFSTKENPIEHIKSF